jgi:hypothetical protein
MPSIQDLQSTIKRRAGLARGNRFRIIIANPIAGEDGKDLTLLCESCTLPGRQILSTDFSVWRNDNKVPTGYSDEDVQCVFILTNDYYVKDLFDKWLVKIINPVSYLAEYTPNFAKTVLIQQLNEDDQPVYEVKLPNAWPLSVNSVELNNESENSIQKLTVTFTYNTWSSRKLP